LDFEIAIDNRVGNPGPAIYNWGMIIARSFWRKAIVTAIAVGGFVSVYEVRAFDSKYVARLVAPADPSGPPAPGDRVPFGATAYCKGITTASGVAVQTGIAAADPALLPVGSVIDVSAPDTKYSGIYTVMDTGPAIQGRLIDIYMWSCYEALDFGRMPIQLTVLRLGWNPKATTPSFLERFFKRSPDKPARLPSRPLPQTILERPPSDEAIAPSEIAP
jgi:3D (Asp-Asp-Asp) domain-containing protein